jgi:hypothetical protein
METPQLPKRINRKDWPYLPSVKFAIDRRALRALAVCVLVIALGFSRVFSVSGLAKVGSEVADGNLSKLKSDTYFPMPASNSHALSICITNPVVTNNTDSGAGSLRQAIIDSCDGGTITFSSLFNSAQTITLASELLIDKGLTITGPGANLLTISGNNAVRVFNISTGNFAVTVSGLTIANGNSTGVSGSGGGIYNSSTGTLNIINSTISGNSANGSGSTNGTASGGGIYNSSTGTLNIISSTLSSNSTGRGNGTWSGGGIYNNSSGAVNITNSNIINNSSGSPFGIADANGGGISNNSTGTVTITNSNVSGNSVAAFCNNSQSRSGNGGGIYNGGGTINVINSSISSNSSFAASIGSVCFSSASGGGISTSGTVNLTKSSIAGNSAHIQPGNSNSANTVGGGGISASGAISVTNSIIADNQNNCDNPFGGPPICNSALLLGPDIRGNFTSFGYNLIGKKDGSTGFANGTNNDQVGTAASAINPRLAALANNGGTTQTMALLPGSPAIDKGSAVGGITTDQRGLSRTVDLSGYANAASGDGSDIGAFEVQTGTPDRLMFNVQPSNTFADSTISPAVTVSTLDGSNNITTSSTNVSLSIGTNPSSGALSGTTSAAAANGTATFADLSINKRGIGYTLVASSGSLTAATSNFFSITCPTITLAPSSLPNGTLGFSYGNNITASGGTAPFTFAVTAGSAPTGLTFNSNGTWSSTPTATGTFNFTVTATAASGCTGSQPYTVLINALTISGRVTKSGNGFGGVTMTLSGGQDNSTLTDSNGNYSFGNIAGNANYTITPSNTNYAFAPVTISFNTLSQNQTAANFTATAIPQLILDLSGPDPTQAVALDSVLFLRDPFPVVNGENRLNSGMDRNTRVMILAANLQLGQGEPSSTVVVNLIDSNNQSYEIAAEDVRPVPNFAFTQVIFRIPDNLPAGTWTVKIKAHGQVSNPGTLRIRL